jgi:hypothetical protein
MNLFFIDKEFKKLNALEDYITFKYEPRSRFKRGNKHIYYDDLKRDFVDEINAYGFSPFIQSITYLFTYLYFATFRNFRSTKERPKHHAI